MSTSEEFEMIEENPSVSIADTEALIADPSTSTSAVTSGGHSILATAAKVVKGVLHLRTGSEKSARKEAKEKEKALAAKALAYEQSGQRSQYDRNSSDDDGNLDLDDEDANELARLEAKVAALKLKRFNRARGRKRKAEVLEVVDPDDLTAEDDETDEEPIGTRYFEDSDKEDDEDKNKNKNKKLQEELAYQALTDEDLEGEEEAVELDSPLVSYLSNESKNASESESSTATNEDNFVYDVKNFQNSN